MDKGIAAWLATKKLLGGQVWEDETEKAIQESDAFLALLSTRSVTKRGHVQAELKKALEVADKRPEEDIYLIPVRIEECDVPSKLQHIHCIDSFAPDDLGEILASLRACAARIGVASGL